MNTESVTGYKWPDAELTAAHAYLLPALLTTLDQLEHSEPNFRKNVFELGCGNGSVAYQLSLRGWDILGVDPSHEGISQANSSYPNLKLYEGSAYDDLNKRFGSFPVVVSLEVVEHVYFPRKYAHTLFTLVEPGGTAILSTPYHGYWKNLALALTGKMDGHFTALWDDGHIKFWSFKTLKALLIEAGFVDIQFCRVGRIPPLARSMVAVARKPR